MTYESSETRSTLLRPSTPGSIYLRQGNLKRWDAYDPALNDWAVPGHQRRTQGGPVYASEHNQTSPRQMRRDAVGDASKGSRSEPGMSKSLTPCSDQAPIRLPAPVRLQFSRLHLCILPSKWQSVFETATTLAYEDLVGQASYSEYTNFQASSTCIRPPILRFTLLVGEAPPTRTDNKSHPRIKAILVAQKATNLHHHRSNRDISK
ncbi:hypothetical protein NMY22_g6733 [Coprinellus aureogranulatus]|nr:hypothetical protein NMY22_g6733 [Coprinellus aureogranulatus]